jgi:hypothetical protein
MRGTLDRDDDTTQATTPVFLSPWAGKKAQFITVVPDPGGFGAFSEITRVIDSEVGLAIYPHIIPIGLLAIEAQSITVSRVGACLEHRGIKSCG